mgnify:CR=1 FL=1
MFKKAVLLSMFIIAIVGIHALDFTWGLKYGAGVSSAFGDDSRYSIHYNLNTIDNVSGTSHFGYLALDSRKASSGFSQSFGPYLETQVAKKVDSVWLLSELQWHRYNYSYVFSGSALSTDNLLLSTTFADTLEGQIDQTVDYITIPLLIKLKQESIASATSEHYDGAYIYFGPSFSVLLSNKSSRQKGINALDANIADFVANSYTDADPTKVYSSSKTESASDKLLPHKIDFVVGAGFNLKNIFNLGIGKDEFFLDFRANTGLYSLGDAPTRTEFRLYSLLFSLGVKL